MSLSIDAKVLHTLLSQVSQANSKTITLDTKEGVLEAVDPELVIRAKHPSLQDSGLSAKRISTDITKLIAIASALKGQITLTYDKSLIVGSGRSCFTLPIFSDTSKPIQCPDGLKPTPGKVYGLDQVIELLLPVINTKKFQGSNSIQFSDDEGILLAAATDGPRLLLIRDEDIPPFNLLLPKRLAKIITNLPKAITLESSATAVVISTEDVTVIGRLTATEFPDWKRVMPENYKLVVQVDTAEMLQALERVGIMASEELPGVVLEFVNNHMLTLVTGGGTAEESININTVTSSLDGNLPKIILHHRYLTDFFKNILKISKTARIFINNKNSPVAIKAGSAHLLICPRMTA